MRTQLHRRAWNAWQRYEYRHTTLAIAIIIIFAILSNTAVFTAFFDAVVSLGYLGAAIGGFFFVSIFTTAPAIFALVSIGQELNPLVVGIIGGFFAMCGDYVLLRFFQDRLAWELQPLATKLGIVQLLRVIRRYKAGRAFLALCGIVVIGSPLPDELGIGLLGVSSLVKWKFLLLTFIANSTGIIILIMAGRIITGN